MRDDSKYFKEESITNSNKMGRQYKTYAQAVKKRKRDELTIFDRSKRVFLNKKTKRRRKSKSLW